MAQRKTERLLSLVALLLKHDRPVAKAAIKRSIPDYRQASAQTFDRIFERDKKELRQMGIRLQVRRVQDGAEIADSREAAGYRAEEIGYAIDRSEYAMPPIEFTSEEWALLTLALESAIGRGGSDEMRELAAKLGCRRPAVWEDAKDLAIAGYGQSRSHREQRTLGIVQEAISQARRLKMDYYSIESDRTTSREVDPYLIFMFSASWYLVGYCHWRQEVRTFKVSRIRRARAVGPEGSYSVPAGFDAASYVQRRPWEFPMHRPITVGLKVDPQQSWLIKRQLGPSARWNAEMTRAEIEVSNQPPLVRWACANCDRVSIETPRELADEVERLLNRVEREYRDG